MDQLIEFIHLLENQIDKIKHQAIEEPKIYHMHLTARQKLEQDVMVLKKLVPVKFVREIQSQKTENPTTYAIRLIQGLLDETEYVEAKYQQQNSLYNIAADLLDKYKEVRSTPKNELESLGKQLCYDIKQTQVYEDLVINPSLRPYFLFKQWDEKFPSRVTKIYRMLETYQQQKLKTINQRYQELQVQETVQNALYNSLEDPQLLKDYFVRLQKELNQQNVDSFQLYTCFKLNDFLKKTFGVSFDPQVIVNSTLGRKLFETLALKNNALGDDTNERQAADAMAYLEKQAIAPIDFNDDFFHTIKELNHLTHNLDQVPAEFLRLNITQKETLYHIFLTSQSIKKTTIPQISEMDRHFQMTSYDREESIRYYVNQYRQQLTSANLASQLEEGKNSFLNVSYEIFKKKNIDSQKLYDLGTYQYQDQDAKLWLCEYQYLIPVTADGRMIHECCTKLDEPMDQHEKLCMYYSKTPDAKYTPGEMFASILDTRQLIQQYGLANTMIYYQTRKNGTGHEDRIRMIIDPLNDPTIEYPLFQQFLEYRKRLELENTLPQDTRKSLTATIKAIDDHQHPTFTKSYKKS